MLSSLVATVTIYFHFAFCLSFEISIFFCLGPVDRVNIDNLCLLKYTLEDMYFFFVVAAASMHIYYALEKSSFFVLFLV